MDEQQKPQEAQQTEQTSTETTGEDQTLDSVYESFKVEPYKAPEQQVQAQPQQAARQAEPDVIIPDPALDPEGYKTFAKANVNETAQLKGVLRNVVQHLQTYESERTRQAEEADIKKAVGIVQSKLKGSDESFVEIAIAHRAKNDPKFMSVWQNRGKNPAALQAALGALGNDYAKKFEFRADPQLAENQRAMKEATQTKAVGAGTESQNDRLSKLTGREFDAEVERIRNTY